MLTLGEQRSIPSPLHTMGKTHSAELENSNISRKSMLKNTEILQAYHSEY